MKLYGKEILDKVRSKELSKDGLVDLMAHYSRWKAARFYVIYHYFDIVFEWQKFWIEIFSMEYNSSA